MEFVIQWLKVLEVMIYILQGVVRMVDYVLDKLAEEEAIPL